MRHVDIGSCQLEVLRLPAKDAGPPKAPLVFLHEGLGSVAMWRDWPAAVAAATGRDAWVYSRRGYGASDPVPDARGTARIVQSVRHGRWLPDYMHVEALEVLPVLLQRLAITEAPVLVGHSDGASIALLYASRHPVCACVVMAPHVMVEDMSIRAIEQARDAFVHGQLRARLARYHRAVDCAFWQWNDAWLNPAFRGFDIRAQCQTITAPLLAIQGMDDPYGSMRQIDEIIPLNGTIQRERLADCGHSPHRDQAAACITLIADFLRRHSI